MVSYQEFDLFSGMRPLEGVFDPGPARKQVVLGHQHSHGLSADVSLAPIHAACLLNFWRFLDRLAQ